MVQAYDVRRGVASLQVQEPSQYPRPWTSSGHRTILYRLRRRRVPVGRLRSLCYVKPLRPPCVMAGSNIFPICPSLMVPPARSPTDPGSHQKNTGSSTRLPANAPGSRRRSATDGNASRSMTSFSSWRTPVCGQMKLSACNSVTSQSSMTTIPKKPFWKSRCAASAASAIARVRSAPFVPLSALGIDHVPRARKNQKRRLKAPITIRQPGRSPNQQASFFQRTIESFSKGSLKRRGSASTVTAGPEPLTAFGTAVSAFASWKVLTSIRSPRTAAPASR